MLSLRNSYRINKNGDYIKITEDYLKQEKKKIPAVEDILTNVWRTAENKNLPKDNRTYQINIVD